MIESLKFQFSLAEIHFYQLTAVPFNVSVTHKFWLIFILVSLVLIMLISCYIILLSDNEQNSIRNIYNNMVDNYAYGMNRNCPISKIIGLQAAINVHRASMNLPPLNYREFDTPSTSLNFEQRARFATYLSRSPFSSFFNIDPIYGNVRYHNTNTLVNSDLELYLFVLAVENRTRRN